MQIKLFGILALCLLVLGTAACVKERPVEGPGTVREEKARLEQPLPEKPTGPGPRAMASLELTAQGRRYIEAGEADRAIRALEQAISLNPGNGQSYYYLAESWLIKGFAGKARQFNRLAESHLAEDRHWEKLVTRQAERILQLEQKIKKAR
jgi:tetratricopeptide (TPR) repeat protein